MQGCATLGVRLWCYTGNVDRTDPAAALTDYGWRSGKEVARTTGQSRGLDWLGYLGGRRHGRLSRTA
jgi:hypothetical protein